MDTKTMLIWGGIAIGAIAIYVVVKMIIDTKKGENSEEKRKIAELVTKLVPDSQQYTAAYAFWEQKNIGASGRSINTTSQYWYYAIAFKQSSIFVIPLSFSGNNISYSQPIGCSKENLGMVNGKDGENWLALYDKNGQEIAMFAVSADNTKDDKYHPVNIQQKDAAEKFFAFLGGFMREVNEANHTTATGKPLKPFR